MKIKVGLYDKEDFLRVELTFAFFFRFVAHEVGNDLYVDVYFVVGALKDAAGIEIGTDGINYEEQFVIRVLLFQFIG